MLAVLSVVAAAWGGMFAIGMLALDALALIAFCLRVTKAAESPDVQPATAALPQRAVDAHPLSGLPMRESLLARMRADQAGVLGAIALDDFERLTAFDHLLAEQVFAAIVARLRAMLPPDRLAVQVDRGRIGLWFAGTPLDAARAELDAIGYALGEAVTVGETRIVPEVRLRLAGYDAGTGDEAATFLARTLASFALSEAAAAEPVPVAEYAEMARERYALEQDLRHAIDRREFSLLYQPLVDAGRGCVGGAEALIRWDHPRLGAVSPGRFVPIMEAMGLANEIGLWALNTALREAHGWAAEGLSGLRVAVNVSGLQLERNDLAVLVGRTLQRHALPASALELELTESVATSDAAHCRRIFADLRAMGVRLAVDDFGTGYSGFSSLRQLAFDKIKIDRQFVTDVDSRRDSQAICQSIIALGRGLGIRVLAEGVERRGEFDWLRRHGCQHFQGYYFAQPLTPAAFRAFVRDADGLAGKLRPPGPAMIQERLSA
jgi:EAL domain-containing protein (putative c-di-GMP-specific phosphodiesterase class I)/GGDEF domain-containing protein